MDTFYLYPPAVCPNSNPVTNTNGWVDDQRMALGSGKELWVGNLMYNFRLGPVHDLHLRFGDYGGNLNIEINGDCRNFQIFPDINHQTIGNVIIDVIAYTIPGGFAGILSLDGEINSFKLGGQELAIDNVSWCPPTDLGVKLQMPRESYYPDDPFWLNAYAYNYSGTVYDDVMMFVLLDIGTGMDYWSWPSWSRYPPDIDYYPTNLPVFSTVEYEIIAPFTWPSGVGTAEDFRFWAAVTNPEMTDVIGDIDFVEFSYYP